MKEKIAAHKNIFFMILAFLVSMCLSIDISKNTKILYAFTENSILNVVLLILIYYLLKNISEIKDKRLKFISFGLSIILAGFEVVGKSLEVCLSNVTIELFIIKCFLNFLGYLVILYIVICKVLYCLANMKFKECSAKWFSDNKRSFLWIWAFIFMAWLPYFLKYFPGITTTDSLHQMLQGLGRYHFTNHHPMLHTGIITVCLKIGKFFGSYNIGIALYSLLQMISVSGVFSFAVYYMAKKKIDYRFRILSVLFFAFYPINGIYSITMWKDIPFSAAMVLLTIIMFELTTNADEFLKSKFKNLLFIISLLLVILFRNNGLYVAILTMPVVLIVFRKHYKKLIVVFSAVLVCYGIWKGPIFKAFDIEEGSIREALSIPLQQFARIEKEHGEELTEEEKKGIHKYLNTDKLAQIYTPQISDNVKSKFNDAEFEKDKGTFVKTWVTLCLKYPKTAVLSFLYNSYGYWYPEFYYWKISTEFNQVDDQNISIPEVERKTIADFKILTIGEELVENPDIPIIFMIFSMGFVFWIVLTEIALVVYKREYKNLLVYVPILILWLTCLASPVSGEFRYIYAMFTCLPLMMGMNFRKGD